MGEPDWQLWRSFRAVLRTGSLSAAARELRLTQPTLGRQIAALEGALGVALFTRSTEGLTPTELALGLAAHAEAMASAASSLVRAASGTDQALRGTIRLAASDAFGVVVLPEMLAAFQEAHPDIEIELSLSDRVENMLRRDADIAVRNVAPAQDALLARRIGSVGIRLFAHRSYCARRGVPASLGETEGHLLIGRPEHLAQLPADAPRLHFGFRCNSDLGLLAAMRAGVGIGYCQAPIALRDPDLLAVLPEIELARLEVWLVTHEDLRPVRRVRVLMDFLAERLAAYVDG